MKSNYTHLSVLLDRSGSMASVKDDTIGGFNTFIDQQKAAPGELTLTLAQFDDVYEVIYDAAPIDQVRHLTEKTFQPRGSTALLDAVAKLIIDTGKKLQALPEDQRPERVMCVILTDGYENASREQTKKSISDMVKHQEDVYNWHFTYIGANQDGFREGASMGMKGTRWAASAVGTQALYASLGKNVVSNRAAARGKNIDLTQEDIDKEGSAI